jgi:hypothetical protein
VLKQLELDLIKASRPKVEIPPELLEELNAQQDTFAENIAQTLVSGSMDPQTAESLAQRWAGSAELFGRQRHIANEGTASREGPRPDSLGLA